MDEYIRTRRREKRVVTYFNVIMTLSAPTPTMGSKQ